MKRHLLAVTRVAWLLTVAGAIAVALYRLWPRLIDELGRVEALQIVSAGVSLLVAKLILAEVARHAFIGTSVSINWRTSLRMYSISQLNKYIPGNIWHLVAKAAMAVQVGLSKRQAAGVVFVENFWLVTSAAVFGAAATFSLPLTVIGIIGQGQSLWLRWLGTVAILAVGVAALRLVPPVLFPRLRGYGACLIKVALLEISVWFMLGLCFFLCLPSFPWELEAVARAFGAFALGWLAGYLSPFAPAGVGVRELVIALLLRDVLPIDQITAALVLNRLVWLVLEVGLGLAALALPRLDNSAQVISADASSK